MHNTLVQLYWDTQMEIQKQIKMHNNFLNYHLAEDKDCSEILLKLGELNKNLKALYEMKITKDEKINHLDLFAFSQIVSDTYFYVNLDDIDIDIEDETTQTQTLYTRELFSDDDLEYPVSVSVSRNPGIITTINNEANYADLHSFVENYANGLVDIPSTSSTDDEEEDTFELDDIVEVPLPRNVLNKIFLDYYSPNTCKTESCAICIKKYTIKDVIMKMPCCKQPFHKNCASKWFQKSVKCPLCNCDIRNKFQFTTN